MKCPRCDYTSFDYLESCRKCGSNLIVVREALRLPAIKPEVPFLLGSLLEDFEEAQVKATIPPPDGMELPPLPEDYEGSTEETRPTVEIGGEIDATAPMAGDTASELTEPLPETGEEPKITISDSEIDKALSEDILTPIDTDEGESTQPLDLDLSLKEISSTDLTGDDALLDLVGESTEPVVDLETTSDALDLGGDTEPIDLEQPGATALGDTDEVTVIETDEIAMSDHEFTDLDIDEKELDDLAKELEDALITAEREFKKDFKFPEDEAEKPEKTEKETDKE